ncbi:MAG: hypothetical protein ABUS79_21790 [Pseudomonadota bacterium]
MTIGLSLPTLVIAALALAGPREEFQRGRTAFLRGEYQRAISTIHPLLYPDLRLESEEEVIQAHRLLGVSYLFENQPDNARSEFRKLLELAPDFRFDALLDPRRVVDFFNDVLREQQSELGDIEARLRKREAEVARRNGQVLERRIERRVYLLNFVPFGAGQFQNQQRRKGWLFFGSETLLGATSLAAFVTNFALSGVRPIRGCLDPVVAELDGSTGVCPNDRVDHAAEDRSRNLTRVQVVTGGLFYALAIWGIVDAIRNFQSEVVVGETRAGPPPPTSFRLSPAVTPSAQGAALTLTF